MEQAKSDTTHPFPSHPTKVIHLSGSDLEIGRRHAESVGDDVRHGMTKFYFEFWKRMSGSISHSGLSKLVVDAAKYAIDPLLIRRLAKNIPAHALDRLKGMTEVTGQPMHEVLTLLVLPDLLPWLQAVSTKVQPDAFVAVNPPSFGCSSFIYRGKRFLHGRNLDFPGVAYWDRYQVIQCTKPNEGLAYIGITTAGVPIGGITGINEAQISVSLHQHYCRTTQVSGMLPFAIGEEILSKARSLDEAKSIIEKYSVATAWAFLITDGKARDGFIYECHPKARGLRTLPRENAWLTHTNYFQTKECQPAEYAATARMNWDNYGRKTRLESLVAGEGHHLTPEKAVTFISDHFDMFWGEEKAFNRTVSQVYNIQSLVLDSENMKLWLAEGDAPIHIRNYQEYDLGEIFAGKDGKTGVSYPGFRFKDPSGETAKEAYILSFIAAMDGNLDNAWTELQRSLDAQFIPEAALTAAVLQMKQGEFERAQELLERALKHLEPRVPHDGQFPPEYFEVIFFLARTYDLLGKRMEAVSHYRRVANHPELEDSNLRKMALKEGPYTPEKLKRILMPYSTYIPFQ